MAAAFPFPHWLRWLAKPARALVRATQLWIDAGGLSMSAAVSFYGILSLAPLLLLLVGVLGWWVDRELLSARLVEQIATVVGQRGAAVVQEALASANAPSEGLMATLLGSGVLLFGATGVFTELQETLEQLWRYGRNEPPPSSWWHTARLRLRGVAYVLAFGFLLLVSLVISTLLSLFSGWAGTWLPLELLLRILNELAAFGLCALLFVGLMRLSGGPKPQLRFLVAGGLVGALFFTAGRQLLTAYLSTAAVVSAYGAAGSFIVLLMWIYFSSAVLLFGAGCARALEEARRPPA